jgi:CMP-N,N'-diacetyllegionaminic acid synthase
MRILALIPARGGSKRLAGKNTRLLGGKPLFVWSIEVVKNITEICDILVSTDNVGIAEIARSEGALVPWIRPSHLATDDASSVDVALHALTWYEREKGKVDGILLLQPTSPFRGRTNVLNGIELFRTKLRHTVVGVSPANSHPLWCFKIVDDQLTPFVDRSGHHARSQDLPAAYSVNGAFYLITPNALRDNQTFFTDNSVPLVIGNPAQSIDIDTAWDWRLAEMVVSELVNRQQITGQIQDTEIN